MSPELAAVLEELRDDPQRHPQLQRVAGHRDDAAGLHLAAAGIQHVDHRQARLGPLGERQHHLSWRPVHGGTVGRVG